MAGALVVSQVLLQMTSNTFTVIDLQTGKEADEREIALHEEWAKGLMYCDMEGFARLHDGSLILTDECGNYRCCPLDRFRVIEAST